MAARSALGFKPAPALRLVAFFAAGAFFAGAAFFAAGDFFAAALYGAAGSFAAFAGAPLRGGNFEVRGSNSKFTLPASLTHARKALNGRRVRIETNLSSRSVLPVASSLLICSRSTGCCRMTCPLLKSQLGVGCRAVGTVFSQM